MQSLIIWRTWNGPSPLGLGLDFLFSSAAKPNPIYQIFISFSICCYVQHISKFVFQSGFLPSHETILTNSVLENYSL